MVAKTSKNPLEVMKFIKFLTNSDSMASYVKYVDFTPSNPQYLGSWYALNSKITGMSVSDLTTLVVGARKYGFESPNHLIVNFSQIENTQKANYVAPIFYGHETAAQPFAHA